MQLRPHQQRALDAMDIADKGQIIVPTGGGKTVVMMQHCLRHLRESSKSQTVVIVAPRILLSNQLYDEFFTTLNGKVSAETIHVHSGEVVGLSTTKVQTIQCHDAVCKTANLHQLIFTTYHSLHKIVDAGINVDIMYCDEAHNAVQRNFFVPVAAMSMSTKYSYFFTATRRVANSHDRGMNNRLVFGDIIENVPAPELINNGSILPPSIVPYKTDIVRTKYSAATIDSNTVQDIIGRLDEENAAKILVAAPNTRVLWSMLSQTDLITSLELLGYNVLHITSKHGAYVNRTKVGREEFFNTLSSWGKDETKKFVVFHYSILSEGINVPGLTHTILLRNLNIVEMAQTIGRVIRVDKQDAQDIADGVLTPGVCQFYRKPCGYVTVPVHSNYGDKTVKRLQNLMDMIFVDGKSVESLVR